MSPERGERCEGEEEHCQRDRWLLALARRASAVRVQRSAVQRSAALLLSLSFCAILVWRGGVWEKLSGLESLSCARSRSRGSCSAFPEPSYCYGTFLLPLLLPRMPPFLFLLLLPGPSTNPFLSTMTIVYMHFCRGDATPSGRPCAAGGALRRRLPAPLEPPAPASRLLLFL